MSVTYSSDRLPSSLSACLPLVWSQVLFPGQAGQTAPVSVRSLLVLLVLPALLLYPSLGFHLFEPDEGRYAEIAREMLQRGEWIVPYLQGEPYLDKPPLFYWLVMGSYVLFGVQVAAARLVPALAIHATIILTYLLGRRSLGERAAFRGALLLTLAGGFLGMGRLLLLDGLLVMWVTLALGAIFEAIRGDRLRWSWWLLAALACGLGVMTKGPIALLLVVPPCWMHRQLTGTSWRLRWSAWLAFLAVVLVVALPWYVAACLRLPVFARHFLWEHNLMRFVQPFDHIRPVWYYVPILLIGLLPGSLLAVHLLLFLLSGKEEDIRWRSPALGYWVLAGGWCVFFFSLAGSKLPTYVLPAFPALSLVFGTYLATGAWDRSRWPAVVAAAFGLLLVAGHNVALPWYAWYRSPLRQPEVLAHYCADPRTHVICYPRGCDSVSFYLGRDDLRNYRSREIEELRAAVRAAPETVVLCTHRHSLEGLRQALPPELCLTEETHFGLPPIPGLPSELAQRVTKLAGETALGLCDLTVVRRRSAEP